MTRRTLALLLVTFGAFPACGKERSRELVESARFGVFFGGQIQERREIPFELDRTRQTQGFRVDFSEPLPRNVTVEFRIDRPLPGGKRRSAGGSPPEASSVESGSLVARVGESRIEQSVPFRPGDPLGLWNVRVVVDGKVVIDRPFEVYDRAARDRASQPDGG